VINRMTTNALVAFNEDIDLAVTGQVAEVRDTLGAKPLQDLANTVNYLIARLKGGTDSRATGARGATAPAAVGRTDGPAGESPSAIRRAARVEADSKFRVISASPECADLIGVRPDALVGLHLIDAIPDKEIVDAVFKTVGLLGDTREQTVVVSPEGRPFRLEVTVSQQGKDQPILIALRVQEGTRS
jgi:hypothetical protein